MQDKKNVDAPRALESTAPLLEFEGENWVSRETKVTIKPALPTFGPGRKSASHVLRAVVRAEYAAT